MTDAARVRIGWDIGGAHVKLAALDAQGRLAAALQVPCALWRGLDQLDAALDQALSGLPDALGVELSGAAHAVTMTGELADVFVDRRQGVHDILARLSRRFAGRPLSVFAGRRGFMAPEQAMQFSSDVASANWLATAQWVAANLADALLVDIGSTTTDLVAVGVGRVQAGGHTDLQRLVSGELVYSGVVRTPLMALGDAVEFDGLRVPLMAEHFATTADVYRISGELDERSDQYPPPDGGAKTIEASARRLARMVGCDARERPGAVWHALAMSFRGAQLERIRRSAQQVLLQGEVTREAPLVAAGSGAFLVDELAQALRRPVVPFAQLVDSSVTAPALAMCAPAVAVAALAHRAAA